MRERWLHELALATDGLDFSGAGFRPPSSSPEEVEELAALLPDAPPQRALSAELQRLWGLRRAASAARCAAAPAADPAPASHKGEQGPLPKQRPDWPDRA